MGVFVNLSTTRRLFYVGDAVDDERGFEDALASPDLAGQRTMTWTLANQIVGRVSELHEKYRGLPFFRPWPQRYKKFFPGGPLSCVSLNRHAERRGSAD